MCNLLSGWWYFDLVQVVLMVGSIGFDWVVVRIAGGWSVVVTMVQLACSGCWVVFDDGGLCSVFLPMNPYSLKMKTSF